MTKNKWIISLGIICVLVVVLFLVQNGGMVSGVPTENDVLQKNTTASTVSKTTVQKKSVSNIPKGSYVVYYTNNGFSPKQSQFQKGKLVTFVNNSDRALLLATDDTVSSLRNELSQSTSIGRGGVLTFNFTYTGLLSFHNVNYPSDHGNIVVY